MKNKSKKKDIDFPTRKRKLLDKDLMRTLEERGFKRKPKKSLSQLKKQKNPSSAKKEKRPSYIKPQIEERKDKPLTKEVMIPPIIKEKKESLFSKIKNIFSGKNYKHAKPEVNVEIKPANIEPNIKYDMVTSAAEEIKSEVKEKDEIEKQIETALKKKPQGEPFPLQEDESKRAPRIISIGEEKPKQGFFSRLRDKFKAKKQDEALEPITLTSKKSDNLYTSSPYSKPGENVGEILKKEIIPQKQESEDHSKETQHSSERKKNNLTSENQPSPSSIEMLFIEKKKKIL